MTGIGDERKAIDENASGVMSCAVRSRTVGSSVYLLDPVTMIAQKRNGDKS